MALLCVLYFKVAQVDHYHALCLAIVLQRILYYLVQNLLVGAQVDADVGWDRVELPNNNLNLLVHTLNQERPQEVVQDLVHRLR